MKLKVRGKRMSTFDCDGDAAGVDGGSPEITNLGF